MIFILPVVLLTGYFTGAGTPAVIKYAPELCGMAVSAFIVIHAVRHGFANIRFIYWVLIVLLALHILFGVIANGVQAGTVIVGGRMYLRTIPFFLLAITLFPNESALKKQFLVVLGVALIQLPIAAYQRVSNYQRALTEGYVSMTGDYVVGTLQISGFLSLFLICLSAIIIALYSKKRIGFGWTALAMLILLAPTMINETKATFFMAPIAIAIPMFAAAGKNRVKNIIKSLVLIGAFLAIFIPVYDYFIMPRWGYGLIEFLTMEGRVEGYLSKDAEVGTTGKAGRFDSISVAMDVLGKNPTTLMFGLGIGNVTESVLGPQFEGEYFSRYGIFAGTTYARLFWEIGFLGAAIVLFLLHLIFSDARRMYRQQNAYGVLAHAYLAIVPVIVLGMLYKDLLLSPAIGICFWYYCGVIAAASQLTANPLPAQGKKTALAPEDLSDVQAAGTLAGTSVRNRWAISPKQKRLPGG